MDELYQMILSPVWWITVVFTGILINIVSSYLRESLDSYLSKISKWWNTRSESEGKKGLNILKG